MESSLTAPFRGRVKEVLVGENVHVAAQAPLLALEPLERRPAPRHRRAPVVRRARRRTAGAGRGDLFQREPAADGVARARIRRRSADVERMTADLHGQCADLLACDPALDPQRAPAAGDVRRPARAVSSRRYEDAGESQLLQSPQEHLHAWLRSLDAEAEGLPPRFVEQLRQALAHYGIDSLERTPALEEACYRLFLSQQRAGTARVAVLSILDRRLEQAEARLAQSLDDPQAPRDLDDLREALDRLVLALEGRDPIVADLAREVRFRYFDEPIIERRARARLRRDRAYTSPRSRASPGDPDRDDLIAEIVDCPRPLAPTLTAAMGAASPPRRRPLLEAMARRYYRVRSLEGFEQLRLDGHDVLLAAATSSKAPRRLLAAAYVELRRRRRRATRSPGTRRRCPTGELAVLDLYAEHRAPAPSHDELAEQLRTALAGVIPPLALHRIVVAVAEPRRGRGMSAIDLFTFRPGPEGLVEDELLRGLHPMMGHRLSLWRLRGVRARAPAVGRGHLRFHGVARTNPKDERLFALAEVRDLTPVRRRRRPRRGTARARAGAGRGARSDPPLPGPPTAEPAPDVESRPAPRLAGDGAAPRRDARADVSAWRRRRPVSVSRW